MSNFTLPVTAWSDSVAVSAATFNAEIGDNVASLIDNLPKRWGPVMHLPGVPTVENGNAMTHTLDASQLMGFIAYQNAAADGDIFTYSFPLAAGTYTLYVLGKTGSTRAKVDWSLNGTIIESGQDWYTGSGNNELKTVSGIVIADADAGIQVLTGTTNGRNASASGWLISLTALWMKQGSD